MGGAGDKTFREDKILEGLEEEEEDAAEGG